MLNCSIKLKIGDEKGSFCGPGLIALLKEIDNTGSVAKASSNLGISYSKVWKMINSSEGRFKTPLVVRSAGGKGGGKAELTEEAKDIYRLYEEMEKKIQKESDSLFSLLFDKYI